ncbi:MAG: hypothetical protein ACFFD8_06315, partial [Candidatus Thorarchaeota archaeon]
LTPLIPTGVDAREIRCGTLSEAQGAKIVVANPQIRRQLIGAVRQSGLVTIRPNRDSNNRVVVTWEKKGQEIHLIIPAENSHLVQRLLQHLTEDIQSIYAEGNQTNARSD